MTGPTENPSPEAVVTARVDGAAALASQGQAVVLLVTPAAAPDAVTALAGGVGPGRVALFVGDPANPADRAGAQSMAAELFGRR
jgi:hypothetical protein